MRTHAAQADNLILQRRVDDAELRFLTQKAMATDETSRRMKLEMAAATQALKDKKELDQARSREAQLEDHAAAAARTHLAYRETVLKDLQQKNRELENKLQIEQDASRRSDRRLVAQVVEEKGKRIAWSCSWRSSSARSENRNCVLESGSSVAKCLLSPLPTLLVDW